MADFSGKTLRLRLPDGSEKPVEIFVACLCFSRLIYAEAVADQSARSWCMAHRRAFEYFGGVPERHRIDCLKSGVIRPGREEFVLNEQFRDLALHYGVAVLPAPPRAAARQVFCFMMHFVLVMGLRVRMQGARPPLAVSGGTPRRHNWLGTCSTAVLRS